MDLWSAPSIGVTAPPGMHAEINQHWSTEKYRLINTVGKEDISISLKKQISWGEFLADLICFRVEFSDKIISTSTILGKEGALGNGQGESPLGGLEPFSYDYKELGELFSDQAKNVAGTYNSLKGVLQSNIISDAFMDMKMYPDFIINDAKAYLAEDVYYKRNFAMHASDFIKNGAELRIYGTHGTLDENVGQFTRLRGGIQRPLLAMRYVVRVILERVLVLKATKENWKWPGFIISSGQQFFHAYEVINVPQSSLWTVKDWWALHHEIAHVIIDNLEDFITMKLPETKLFLAQKNGPAYWFNFAEEVAAEYIGYELGFFGDYGLFLDKTWKYLKDLSPKEPHFRKLEIYALRTYLVGIIERLFGECSVIDKADVINLQWNYEQIVDHIEKIYAVECDYSPEQMETLYRERYFVASNHASLAGEMLPLLERFSRAVNAVKARPRQEEIEKNDYEDLLERLKAGEVLDEEIRHPERLVCEFMQNADFKDNLKANIAIVQSFSNLERKYLDGVC